MEASQAGSGLMLVSESALISFRGWQQGSSQWHFLLSMGERVCVFNTEVIYRGQKFEKD